VWFVEQVCWDADFKKGKNCTLLVEADSASEAAILSGEGDGIHEIVKIVNLGPIVVRQKKIIVDGQEMTSEDDLLKWMRKEE